jgi:hypothetical protein
MVHAVGIGVPPATPGVHPWSPEAKSNVTTGSGWPGGRNASTVERAVRPAALVDSTWK